MLKHMAVSVWTLTAYRPPSSHFAPPFPPTIHRVSHAAPIIRGRLPLDRWTWAGVGVGAGAGRADVLPDRKESPGHAHAPSFTRHRRHPCFCIMVSGLVCENVVETDNPDPWMPNCETPDGFDAEMGRNTAGDSITQLKTYGVGHGAVVEFVA